VPSSAAATAVCRSGQVGVHFGVDRRIKLNSWSTRSRYMDVASTVYYCSIRRRLVRPQYNVAIGFDSRFVHGQCPC
jgi:hypothetical protein